MTPEARVKKKIEHKLLGWGAYVSTPIGTRYGNNGTPDILACIGGLFFGIEAKADGQMPTWLQTDNLCEIAFAGGVPLVIDKNNVDQLDGFIKRAIEEYSYGNDITEQDYYRRACDHWADRKASAEAEGDGIRVR